MMCPAAKPRAKPFFCSIYFMRLFVAMCPSFGVALAVWRQRRQAGGCSCYQVSYTMARLCCAYQASLATRYTRPRHARVKQRPVRCDGGARGHSQRREAEAEAEGCPASDVQQRTRETRAHVARGDGDGDACLSSPSGTAAASAVTTAAPFTLLPATAVSRAVPSVHAARATTFVAVHTSVASRPASAAPTPPRTALSTLATCACSRRAAAVSRHICTHLGPQA
jgi:hypothetical protein